MLMRTKVAVLAISGATLGANSALADCVRLVDEPSQKLARAQVERCETSTSYAERLLEDVRLQWVVGCYEMLARTTTGIVFSGTVTQTVGVKQYSERDFELTERSDTSFDGVWFYPTGDDELCSEWLGQSVVVMLSDPCCDVFPPPDFPCFFGVGQSAPVPAPLESVLRP